MEFRMCQKSRQLLPLGAFKKCDLLMLRLATLHRSFTTSQRMLTSSTTHLISSFFKNFPSEHIRSHSDERFVSVRSTVVDSTRWFGFGTAQCPFADPSNRCKNKKQKQDKACLLRVGFVIDHPPPSNYGGMFRMTINVVYAQLLYKKPYFVILTPLCLH